MKYESRLDADALEIRLLLVHSGEATEEVQCSLQLVSLTDKPKFTALSYVWGDTDITTPIRVDGQVFDATASLESALRHIRKGDVEETLWVDAVCINQEDMVERQQQITLMGDLYSKANRVIIWLGEQGPASEQLTRIIQREETLSAPEPGIPEYTRLHEESAAAAIKNCLLLEDIGKRPWWRRVCTMQECILPQNEVVFKCGLAVFEWTNFFQFFFTTWTGIIDLNIIDFETSPFILHKRELGEIFGPGFMDHPHVRAMSMLAFLRQTFISTQRSPTLSEVVTDCLDRHAGLPHDYVHGILGLASGMERGRIEINYSRPYQELYQDFMEQCFSDGGPNDLVLLDLISFQQPMDGYPSWVPDLSRQKGLLTQTGLGLASPTPWKALKEVQFSDDGKFIILQGVLLDTIVQVVEISTDEENFRQQLSDLSNIARLGMHRQRSMDSTVSSLHSLLRTPNKSLRGLFMQDSTGCYLRLLQIPEDKWDDWWEITMDPNHPRFRDITSREPDE